MPDAASDMSSNTVSPAAVFKTCALELSCPLWPSERSGSACVAEYEQGITSFFDSFYGTAAQFRLYVECASAASDCTGVLECVSRNHGPDYCSARFGESCDGDLETSCEADGWAYLTTDCAALGERCSTANGSASCTNGVSCQPGVPDLCDGNRLIRCDPETHLQSSVDCSSFAAGATCGTYMGFADCIPRGAACVGPYPIRCDGNALVDCISGHEFPIDCAAFASHCVDSGASSACVTDETTCDAGSSDRCSGDSLQICANGRFESIDCASIGFRTCVATEGNVSDLGTIPATAKCVP